MIKTTLTMWGEPHTVSFVTNTYYKGKTLYVGAVVLDDGYEEPWCDVTVNLPDEKMASDTKAFLDTNNCSPEILNFLEEKGYIENTYRFAFSGWCMYPLYIFTEKFFKEMSEE